MDYQLSDDIEGWFYKEDRDIFNAILSHGGPGDLLEIGCYLGKSTILMGYGRRPQDTLLCCDLWGGENDGLTGDEPELFESLTLPQFLSNWDKYHDWRPTIRQCSSTDLSLDGLNLRFSHIDGCHQYDYAAHDIRLAASKTRPDGVVVVDDWSAEHLPGVAAATWHAQADRVIFPFLVTPHKLYASVTPAGQDGWHTVLARIAAQENWAVEDHRFPTYQLLVVPRDGTEVTHVV